METAIVMSMPIDSISVKFSALLGLRRALVEERYEECARWVDLAHHWGAQALEIRRILREPLEGLEGR